MRLLVSVALKHLLARKRQSVVSLMGIVLGVAFFLAIAGLMRGSENDFIRRLVDNSPHITLYDEYRNPRPQPIETAYPDTVVELRSVKPQFEVRGIRGYQKILDELRAMPGVRAAAVLSGQALVSFAGRDVGISLSGMLPGEVEDVTTIAEYIKQGSVADLIANRDGIIVGQELLRKLSLGYGDNLTVATTTGQLRTFKIVGVFRTGQVQYDASNAFVDRKRVQSLLDRPNRVNSIIVKLPEPAKAHALAADLEGRYGYKSVSWQEASEDIMSTLAIRNTIMYTVVSAVLIVAAFGIYNVISTVVMEKQRDIAILKSMGFHARDIRGIFLVQGVVLGVVGCLAGVPLGCFLMWLMMQVSFQPPGLSEKVNLPVDWGLLPFAIAIAFAMGASVMAALLPARKAAKVFPVDILRGGSG